MRAFTRHVAVGVAVALSMIGTAGLLAAPAHAATWSTGFGGGCWGYVQVDYTWTTTLKTEADCNVGGSTAPTYRAMLIGDNGNWYVGDTKTMRWNGARWTSDGLRVFGNHSPTHQTYNLCGLISNPRTGALLGGTCRKIKIYRTWGGFWTTTWAWV